MGITGLLPLMKGASTEISLSKLKGSVAVIDTNGWIHRACYSCADKIYLNEPTDMYVNYCINFCLVLRKHQITPILVFDGQSLPAKSETKLLRQKRKQQVREQIEELRRRGQESQARWLMRQCVDVTFEMVHKVIERCREEKFDCIVAPYEADAQMTYLVNQGIADFAITEDSDLLAFGCPRVLYKLDRDTARGRMVDLTRLHRCFKNMDLHKFQLMCILSGCDYLENIPGIGIGRSKKFFESYTGPTERIADILQKVPILLKMANKIQITADYIKDFIKAYNTFNHQIIYCPRRNQMTYLHPINENLTHDQLRKYAGDFFDSRIDLDSSLTFVRNYILGNVCPKTLKIIDHNHVPCESWFASIICERIECSSIEMNVPSMKIIECSSPSIDPELESKSKRKLSTKPKSNEKSSKDSSMKTLLEDSPIFKEKNLLTARYNRDMFKSNDSPKNCDPKTKTMTKSKYFTSTKSKSIPNQDEFSPSCKRKKSDNDTSSSSIEIDEMKKLVILNSQNNHHKSSRSSSVLKKIK
ncbi:alpha-ketoglutarate-dependent dioxygenase alkB-like 6 [Sarcoptes scabiei]|nr:alpha-ketoglutarate-dependent dioxygenase alkB-like 6 [Sarcoptes scabiei]